MQLAAERDAQKHVPARSRATRMIAVSGLFALSATGMSVLGAGSASAKVLPASPCSDAIQTALPGQVVTLVDDPPTAPTALPTLLNALSPPTGTQVISVITPVGTCNVQIAPLPPVQKITPTPTPTGSGSAPTGNPGTGVPTSGSAPKASPTSAPAAPAPARAASAPASGPAPAAAPAPGQSTGPTSYGHVPRYTYGDLTSVPAGGAGFALDQAPLTPPGFDFSTLGALSTPTAAAAAQLIPTARKVSNASEVTALPSPMTTAPVPMETVLATLLLALTTATLVRKWVLRGTAS